MLKFDFSIRTRSGQKIESIVIAGRDRADAERKLVQMYRQCTIVHCQIRYREERCVPAALMEAVPALIAK